MLHDFAKTVSSNLVDYLFIFFFTQMISTRYVSFLSGIVIASLTWAFSLYLYSRLSQNSITASPTILVPGVSIHGEREFDKELMIRDNVIIARNEKHILSDKKTYNLKGERDYRGNNLFLQQLQPVPVKPAVTLDQGTNL